MFDIKKYYADFEYPQGYYDLLDLNLTDFDFWYFFREEFLDIRTSGLKERFPERKLVPFARRGDNDNIACFEAGKGEKVFIVHDFASPGWERRREYDNIWLWLKDAVGELVSSRLEENDTPPAL